MLFEKKEKKKNPDERVVVWSQPYWQQRLFSKIGDGIKWALKSIYNLPQILYFRGGSSSGEEANDGATDWQTDNSLGHNTVLAYFSRLRKKREKIVKNNKKKSKLRKIKCWDPRNKEVRRINRADGRVGSISNNSPRIFLSWKVHQAKEERRGVNVCVLLFRAFIEINCFPFAISVLLFLPLKIIKEK